jgi:anti-anti-sigma factor
LDIVETREGAVTVLKPAGPLLLGDADQFRACFVAAMPKCLGRLVLDASAVAYVDSRGLEVLVEVGEEMSHGGQALKMCGANETLREVMELTETIGNFEHFADIPSAVRSFL